MELAAFSFVIVFALIVSGGMLLFYRQALVQRISDEVVQHPSREGLLDVIQQTGFQLSQKVVRLEHMLPRSEAAASRQGKRLIHAGYRNNSAARIFNGVRFLCPLALCVIVTPSGLLDFSPVFAYCMSLGVGFLLPDFWLSWRIAKRKKQIQLGLPEALDFLVICIEAGLGMDQALARTAQELRRARPALSDELDVVVLEQRAGRSRSEAWRQFAERTDVESVRVLVSVLVQSEQLGTSVAKTLRVHSDTFRMQRRQQVEEKGEKTRVKLVFPLVLLIFPSLFLVMLGPEAIIMMESFPTYFR